MTIKNALRKKQIKEYVDEDHAVMDVYYDILDSDFGIKKIEQEMRKLIKKDEYFFDPYVILYDILDKNKQKKEAAQLLSKGYKRAVMKIADQFGNWPMEMLWGFMENRHLMRIIERYGLYCWKEGDTKQALDIFRCLLHANPRDNQGARHYILAIRLGLKEDMWCKPFEVKRGKEVVGLNAGKLCDWFNEKAKKYPDEFDWLFEIWKKEEMI